METFDVQQPCKRSQGKRIKPSYFRKGVKIRVLYFILFFSDKVLLELWVHQEGSQTSDKIQECFKNSPPNSAQEEGEIKSFKSIAGDS